MLSRLNFSHLDVGRGLCKFWDTDFWFGCTTRLDCQNGFYVKVCAHLYFSAVMSQTCRTKRSNSGEIMNKSDIGAIGTDDFVTTKDLQNHLQPFNTQPHHLSSLLSPGLYNKALCAWQRERFSLFLPSQPYSVKKVSIIMIRVVMACMKRPVVSANRKRQSKSPIMPSFQRQ